MLSRLFNLPWPPGFFQCGCPCDTQTNACSKCPDGAPAEWTFDVSGIIDNFCTQGDCPEANGTFTLIHQSGCIWKTATFGSTCIADSFWKLEYFLTPDRWELQHLGPNISSSPPFVIDNADFDCLGDNILASLSTVGIECKDYPATATISPV